VYELPQQWAPRENAVRITGMHTQPETDELQQYDWASSYLERLIQGPPSPPPDATQEEIRSRAIARNERLRSFLEFIGNPHLDYRTIHIAGTSGKGSTSAFLASILTAANFRTGLHVSPYLQVETEKLQINDRLMSATAFAKHVRALDDEVSRWKDAGNVPLTYGEFWVALTFFSFSREQCEYVVCEAGAGGRFDLTNVVRPDVTIITSVGLDHVRTLGGTIPSIAWHKAGIIKPGIPVVTTVDDPEALAVIRAEAAEQGAQLTELAADRDFTWTWQADAGAGFLETEGLSRPVRLPLVGPFQASNAAIAIRAARLLHGEHGAPVPDAALEEGIERTRFPGRVEIVQREPQVILDGAHNPEKVEALVQALSYFPGSGRRILVLGSLGGHDFLNVAKIVAPEADEIIITAPSAVERASAPVDEIVETVEQSGRPFRVVLEPAEAIQTALAIANREDQIVVTGSLYLVGAIREHWYPSRAILTQQTPYPEVSNA
jgi:dihydrofolate synthase / folylpolyglutamate synthase